MAVEINLEGKVALVTGASRGIGEATAKTLARAGADLVITSTPGSHDLLEAVGNEIAAYGHKVVTYSCDITEREGQQELVKVAVDNFERIDILVHNAGVNDDTLDPRMTSERWKRVFDVNIHAPADLTRIALRAGKFRWPTSIIAVSSDSAHGNAGQGPYAASKAALETHMKTLADEFGGRDIRVNSVAFGLVDTDMAERLKALSEEKYNEYIDRSSLKRIILPREAANAILFLASDLSSAITRQVMTVDAGVY